MNRTGFLLAAAIVTVLSIACCGGVGIATADDDEMPGEPASFYGEAIETNGTEIPTGTEIVAVVNGSVEGEITVGTPGEYGEAGAFDDKLRVDSTAGDEVTFRLAGPNGSVGGTAALESGIAEENLTFPDGSIEELPPTPSIDIDPAVATAGESIAFSATESTAHDGSELVSFAWSIERDGEAIETFDGEESDRSIETAGEYDVVLTVTDTNGRTATETAGIEIEGDDTGGSTGSGGGSGGGSTTVSGSGGGAGSVSSGESGDSETTESGATEGSGTADSSGGFEPSREPIFAETHRIEDQFPDTPGTAVVFEETSIREIVLENRSTGGEISIEEFDEPTDDAPPLPGERRVASASEITVPDDQRNSDAIIRAVVSDEWLAERGIAPEHLTVYRLPDGGGRWEALPTEAFEIDGGYTVEARTPGFSQFVVAGLVPPSEDGDGSEAAETETETSADRESSEPTEAETSTETTGFNPTSPVVPLAFLGALLIVVAAIGRLFIPRRRERW